MIALAALVIAAAAPLADDAEAAPARLSVIIGYDGEEGGERTKLAYADDDAARVYLASLQESDQAWLLTTFDRDSARLFPELTETARAPTRVELAHVLGEAFWRLRALHDAGRRTELVFYFAGHGDVSASGEGFLVFKDGALTRTELATQVVRGSPADVNHVLIDACASYFMVARGDATATAVPLTPALLDVMKPQSKGNDDAWARTGTLVSTSDSSAVHETSELGSGVFSYLLRSALAGAGDIDGDGRVEYAEAAAFIAAASAAIDDPRARLAVHSRAPAQRPHAALGDLRRGKERRFLSIEAGAGGESSVRVLDEHGVPYAEVRPGAGVRLALHGSAFFVVQVGKREATLVPRRAGAYALSSLHFEDSPQSRGRSGAFASLFARPFDASFFEGWLAVSSLPKPLTGPAWMVAYADGAEPPLRLPLAGMAVGAFSVAAALAVASGTSAVMNLVAFQDLQRNFDETATVDAEGALAVEAWRTSATLTGALAVGAAVSGAGLWWASTLDDSGAAP